MIAECVCHFNPHLSAYPAPVCLMMKSIGSFPECKILNSMVIQSIMAWDALHAMLLSKWPRVNLQLIIVPALLLFLHHLMTILVTFTKPTHLIRNLDWCFLLFNYKKTITIACDSILQNGTFYISMHSRRTSC